MKILLRFTNWLRERMDTLNFNSRMEGLLMGKKKGKDILEEGLEKYTKDMDRINDQIDDAFGSFKNESNWDLVFKLIPTALLKEIYDRLEEGQQAIEENKRIKASLDTVNDAIKKMFKLV